MGKQRDRKQEEAKREEAIRRALRESKKPLADSERANLQRTRPVEDLHARLTMDDVPSSHVIRPLDAYVPESHNLEKQMIGLIDHLYVRYPVPEFMYQVCFADVVPDGAALSRRQIHEWRASRDPFYRHHRLYRRWFITMAQGGSFARAVKGIMTSREAALFYRAPLGYRIHENVWWSKMTALSIPPPLIRKLITRIYSRYYFDDPDGRLTEALHFFANHHAQLHQRDLDEVIDFLAWKLCREPTFRMKGRTAASVIRLSNEWHLQIQQARDGNRIEWVGMALPEWELVRELIWAAVELRTSNDLADEGRKQRHCVYSYVDSCRAGRSAVFSIRAYGKGCIGRTPDGAPVWGRLDELTRITVEVEPRSRRVVQVRGKLNALVIGDNSAIIRCWAGEQGLAGV